jgi:hypothetical protein
VTKMTLDQLADTDTNAVFDLAPPITLELTLEEHPSPSVLTNLAKLQKLNICTAEAIMSLVGQAPIDPINLMATLMQAQPEGWAFSAIDFTMVRVLARTRKKAVSAALRVDLMSTAISGLAINQAGQLTIFKTLEIEPGPDTLQHIETLCAETVAAAARETAPR